jgi:hypothetical protein
VPPEVTDAELVCLAVAQVLLRFDDERHWLRAVPRRGGPRADMPIRAIQVNRFGGPEVLTPGAARTSGVLRAAEFEPGRHEELIRQDLKRRPRGA